MLRIDVQRLYKISVGRFDGKGFFPFVVYESFQNEQGAVRRWGTERIQAITANQRAKEDRNAQSWQSVRQIAKIP